MAQRTIDPQKITNEVTRLLKVEGIVPQEIILYGSQTTGAVHDGSDVDIVVISPDFERFPSLGRLEMLARIAWKSNYPLEILGYTPDEVKDKAGKSIIWDEILASGKTLYRAA